jgi:WS/DGAT/MGAT family acyltransferase
MSSYERLSALDAQFLYWDSPETPMNMGNVCVFEGEPFFDRNGVFKIDEVRQVLASRLHLVPRYRKKLRLLPGGVGHPVLVDDPDFDIASHVRVTKAPAPGGEAELKQVFSRVHEGMLDRSRPLWEICFVEGLVGGRVGMVQKIHHAPYDGQSTVDVLERLLDKTPVYLPTAPVRYQPVSPPASLDVLADELLTKARLAWSAWVCGENAPLLKPAKWSELAKAVISLTDLLWPPSTSLNRPLGPRRRLDWVKTTLSDVKRIRSLLPGATLNDAMLACIAGGIRALMQARGEDVDSAEVRVFIPVSLRSDEERDAEGGNRISGFVVPLPVAEADPLARMRLIHTATTRSKKGSQPLGIHLIGQFVEFLLAPVLKAGAPYVIRRLLWQNLTVTNVQGPRQPLYLLGARMLELNPMVPLGCQLSLNFAVESYVDDLRIGLSSDADLLPDLDHVKRGVEESLQVLLGMVPRTTPAAAAATTKPKKATRTAAAGLASDARPPLPIHRGIPASRRRRRPRRSRGERK